MPKSPNTTILFIALSFIVVFGIAGGVLLTIFDKDATTFYGFFTATLATVVAFGGLARQSGAIKDDVEQVRQNVNGRMSRLLELATANASTRGERAEAEKIGVESGVIPVPERVYSDIESNGHGAS